MYKYFICKNVGVDICFLEKVFELEVDIIFKKDLVVSVGMWIVVF